MYRRICFWAVTASLLGLAALLALLSSKCRGDVGGTVLVSNTRDDYSPEPPLSGEAARKAEQEAAAKLTAMKDRTAAASIS